MEKSSNSTVPHTKFKTATTEAVTNYVKTVKQGTHCVGFPEISQNSMLLYANERKRDAKMLVMWN